MANKRNKKTPNQAPKLVPSRRQSNPWHSAGIIMIAIILLALVGSLSYSAGRWQLAQEVGHRVRTALRTKPTAEMKTANLTTIYDDALKLEFNAQELMHEENVQRVNLTSKEITFHNIELSKYKFATARPIEAIWLLNTLRMSLAADTDFVRLAATTADKRRTEGAKRLSAGNSTPALTPAPLGTFLPILIYHKTPGDFEAQLQYLRAKNYTTITMSHAACGIRKNCALPAKPVVLTFDDGFSDQIKAFNLLKKYQMRATYYLIIGGEMSKHCLGIERIPAPCGDSYLNWGEVHMLASSSLIEIGAHTVDHLALAGLNPEDQAFQINTSKQRLEQVLGIKVTSFAYPYGSFDSISTQLVQQAGFTNAVSTIPGSDQTMSNLFALHRIREVYKLP